MQNSFRIKGRQKRLVGILSALFVLVNAVAFTRDIYLLAVLPIAVFVGYLLIYNTKFLLLFIVFATPLSFNFEDMAAFGGIGFYFPTEPLLFVLMLLYFAKLLGGHREKSEFLRHPLTLAILFNLIWLTVTVFTSIDWVVSLKFLVARLWFVLVMYFMINLYFSDRQFIRKFYIALIFSMAIVIVYTVTVHSSHGFSDDAGHWVMWPFFKDHTSYGAIIALLIPFVLFHLYRAKPLTLEQLMWLVLAVIFVIGIYLSYTRAAWVSLVGALGIYFLVKLKIDYKLVMLGLMVLAGGFFAFQNDIIHQLEKNRQDSSDSFAEHIQSITNISSDASNLERLNRWNSALQMFADKPFFGHGPGTYMFQYAKYQKSSDKTIISTNQGDGGNAHSEYLGPLSESGVLGMLSILLIVLISIFTGVKLYYQLDHDPYLKGVVMCIVLGLTTYYLHGVLNNFLDTDKASIPVWGSMSILVAISIYHRKQSPKAAAE